MGQYMEIQDSRGRRGRRGSSTKSVPGQLEISWWRHSSEFIFIPTKLGWSGDYREFSPSNVIMPLSAGHRGEQKLLIVIPLHYCFGGYTFSFSSSSTLLIRCLLFWVRELRVLWKVGVLLGGCVGALSQINEVCIRLFGTVTFLSLAIIILCLLASQTCRKLHWGRGRLRCL